MLSDRTQRRALPRYKNEEIKTLNIISSSGNLTYNLSRLQSFVLLRNDCPLTVYILLFIQEQYITRQENRASKPNINRHVKITQQPFLDHFFLLQIYLF